MVLQLEQVMKLKDWLADERRTFAAFGEEIGRTAEAVRRYANGDRIPDRDTMPLIVSATSGRVTANDFFDLPSASHDEIDTARAVAPSAGNAAAGSPEARHA